MADANAQVVEAGADADVLLWLSPTDTNGLAATLEKCPNAKWVQLPWAGIEAFVEAGVLDPSRTWTCGKGVYAEPVAEHALALALAGLRELPMRIRATTWERQGGVSLYDGKATVLGSGGITACLLDLLRPMRTAVTVVRRDTATPLDWTSGEIFNSVDNNSGAGMFFDARGLLFVGGPLGVTVFDSNGNFRIYDNGGFTSVDYDPFGDRVFVRGSGNEQGIYPAETFLVPEPATVLLALMAVLAGAPVARRARWRKRMCRG